ncbi:MAG: hypothetical protein NT092_10525 [Bacteroidia bacterium]|nr:hypothetical protein [Bacteroidia bacterium]
MKKCIFISLIIFFFSLSLKCQTVDSIKVEQAGEFIKVHYKILNSNQYQTFRVTLFCSINNGLKSELKSLVGDFGENVIGGKPEYIVIWDVLKDVEEVTSADFSVRAELLQDNTPHKEKLKNEKNIDPIQAKWEKKRFFILPGGGEGWGMHWGIRIGYMGSWGFSAKYMIGKQDDRDLPQPENYFHTSIDLTKRIISKNKFQAHLIAGVAGGKIYGGSPGNYYWETHELTGEIGVVLAFDRVAIFWAITPYSKHDGSFYPRQTTFTNWGLGLRF